MARQNLINNSALTQSLNNLSKPKTEPQRTTEVKAEKTANTTLDKKSTSKTKPVVKARTTTQRKNMRMGSQTKKVQQSLALPDLAIEIIQNAFLVESEDGTQVVARGALTRFVTNAVIREIEREGLSTEEEQSILNRLITEFY